MFQRITNWPIWIHSGALIASFVALGQVQSRLDALYAASQHPVDYATGQTTFDAARIKGFYAHMQEAGSLDIYVQTQQFDFVFMLAMACFGVMLGSFVARAGRDRSAARSLGFVAAGLAVAGALLDALENAVSFVMLAQPQGFADWLALPYSGFASAKFAAITLAMLCVLLALLAAAAGRVLRRPRLG